MKKIIFIVSIFLVSGFQYGYAMDQGEVCYKDKCIKVEEAKTFAEKTRGLQGRTKMTDDQGMLFIFDKPENSAFWMKDMQMSIDMIWLDEKGTVQAIDVSVPPCKTETCMNYTSGKPTKYVLEVAAGFSGRRGIKEGELLKIRALP
ncbi:MAG: DUF192 domain-containing protein [Candidatus Omnitrophica bacterium]|nr:DUF192 domain-containing protein [Candidatus Omnitrophota bacterium]